MKKYLALALFLAMACLKYLSTTPSLTIASAQLVLALGLGFVLFGLVQEALEEIFDAPMASSGSGRHGDKPQSFSPTPELS